MTDISICLNNETFEIIFSNYSNMLNNRTNILLSSEYLEISQTCLQKTSLFYKNILNVVKLHSAATL